MRQWDDRSRMSREAHVRFWESAGVKLPRATQLPQCPVFLESHFSPIAEVDISA